jgi:hypothetical protein
MRDPKKKVEKNGIRVGKKYMVDNLNGHDPNGIYDSLVKYLLDLGMGNKGSDWEHFGVDCEVLVLNIDGNKAHVGWYDGAKGKTLNTWLWFSNLSRYDQNPSVSKTIHLCRECKKELIILGVLGWCDNCKDHFEV